MRRARQRFRLLAAFDESEFADDGVRLFENAASHLGFRVTSCRSRDALFECLEARRHDVVVMSTADLEWVAATKAATRAPVVLLSSSDNELWCDRHGIHFLPEPCSPTALLDGLEDAIESETLTCPVCQRGRPSRRARAPKWCCWWCGHVWG